MILDFNFFNNENDTSMNKLASFFAAGIAL